MHVHCSGLVLGVMAVCFFKSLRPSGARWAGAHAVCVTAFIAYEKGEP